MGRPPELPVSARVVRPSSDRLPTEPPLDEATDVSEKNPLSAARVRRPTTGIFEFGDENAPKEPTSPDIAPIVEDTHLGATPPPQGRYRWAVFALAAALAVLVISIVVRLVTAEPTEPTATAPVVAEIAPETEARIRFGQGAAAAEAGKDGDAEKIFTELINADHRPIGSLAGLTTLYLKAGKLAEAQQLLEALSRARPKDARVHAYLGFVVAEQGRVDEARAHFAKATSLAPGGPLAERLEALTAGPE